MIRLGWLWQDFRFGLRSLAKDLRFTGLAILTLALGIAAATTIFSVLDSVILEPFPYKDPGRLSVVIIHDLTHPDVDGSDRFSLPELMDFREHNHVFSDLAGMANFDVLYNDGKQAHVLDGCWMTPNTVQFFGVKPLLGRPITEADGKPGAPPVFAMTYRLWTRQFNSDPKLIGATMNFNGVPTTLVSVMPPRWLPDNRDIFIPIAWSHSDFTNSQLGNLPQFFVTIGRLKPSAGLQAAVADFEVIARREAAVYPKYFPASFSVLAQSMGQRIGGTLSKTLYLLLGAAGMLLLIACSNVANLLLARATVREKEIAIRASVGASHGRIVLQLLAESFLLAAAGCTLGCALAYAAVKGAAAIIPTGWYAFEAVIGMKPVALGFAVSVALLTTLLCGLAPAIHSVRGALQTRLTDTGKGVSGSFRHGKFRAGLVVAEVALSILMLAGAGLTIRSLFALEHVELGFNPDNVLFTRISFPPGRYDTAQQKRVFFQQVLQLLAGQPGVVSAATTSGLPPYGGIGSEVTIPGKTHAERWAALLQFVSQDYLRAMQTPLLRGRMLSDEEVDSARHVAVINQAFARSYFKDEDPIGKTVKFNLFDQLADTPHDAYFEIVGVAQDVKNAGVRGAVVPEALVPYTITGGFFRGIMVRTTGDPLLTLPALRQAVSSVDSTLPLTFTGTLQGYLQQFSYAEPQFGLMAMVAFAAVGLLLVMIGIFSVMAYTVELQTHEIGVRMALGAPQQSILRMVIVRGFLLIAAGIVLGALTTFALLRLVASQFWGVSASDPWTFGTVIAVVVAVGLAACIFPARKAMRVDPIVALRYE